MQAVRSVLQQPSEMRRLIGRVTYSTYFWGCGSAVRRTFTYPVMRANCCVRAVRASCTSARYAPEDLRRLLPD